MPTATESTDLLRLVSLKLAAFDVALSPTCWPDDFIELARPLLRSYESKTRHLMNPLSPADERIQAFLDSYLEGCDVPRLPGKTLVLDHPGMARLLSLPAGRNTFSSPYLKSYRGVLHNPLRLSSSATSRYGNPIWRRLNGRVSTNGWPMRAVNLHAWKRRVSELSRGVKRHHRRRSLSCVSVAIGFCQCNFRVTGFEQLTLDSQAAIE